LYLKSAFVTYSTSTLVNSRTHTHPYQYADVKTSADYLETRKPTVISNEVLAEHIKSDREALSVFSTGSLSGKPTVRSVLQQLIGPLRVTQDAFEYIF